MEDNHPFMMNKVLRRCLQNSVDYASFEKLAYEPKEQNHLIANLQISPDFQAHQKKNLDGSIFGWLWLWFVRGD